VIQDSNGFAKVVVWQSWKQWGWSQSSTTTGYVLTLLIHHTLYKHSHNSFDWYFITGIPSLSTTILHISTHWWRLSNGTTHGSFKSHPVKRMWGKCEELMSKISESDLWDYLPGLYVKLYIYLDIISFECWKCFSMCQIVKSYQQEK